MDLSKSRSASAYSTSKPPIQVPTASIRRPGTSPNEPRTAIQAPAGPDAMARPRARWQSAVKRLVSEYPYKKSSATGDSARHSPPR